MRAVGFRTEDSWMRGSSRTVRVPHITLQTFVVNSNVLTDDTIARLRTALQARLAAKPAAGIHLDAAVAAAASDAAGRSMPVERLVILVKEVWDSVLREIPGSHSSDSAEVREALIKSVIKAYYVH